MLSVLLALFLAMTASSVSAQPSTQKVERWRVAEITLTSSHAYKDPFDDVTVSATFTHGNVVLVRPAFWDGGNLWKIRFAPTEIGVWHYRTTCSNPTDIGLEGRTGVMQCVPYRGDLAIYKHGFVKVSANHRYFTYADGTPFFYLGDTHWEIMHERFNTSNYPGCSSQFKCEVDKRVKQGFTVYQTEWMAGGLTNPNEPVYDWDDGISDADMPGFRNADRKFQYLANHGLVVANAMNWRGLIPKYPDDYLRKLGRYWAARYGAYPVLWTMGQETDGLYPDDPRNLDEKWQVLAKALSENDAYHHPLSAHMCNTGTTVASNSLWRDKPYHTWYAAQVRGAPLPVGVAEDFWNSLPTKPAILYEPPYENFWTNRAGERIRAYVAFLSGFYGFGYGVAGVWDDNYSDTPVRDSGTTYDPHFKFWYDGLNRKSGDDMTRMRDFFSKLNWWRLIPRYGDAKWQHFIRPSEARLATDGWKTYVAFFYNKTTDTGALEGMDPHTQYTAHWYDPANGNYTLIGANIQPDTGGSWVIPAKPDDGDWALLVQANDVGASPPSHPNPKSATAIEWFSKGVANHFPPPKVVGGLYQTELGREWVSLSGEGSYVELPGTENLDGMQALTISVKVRLNAYPPQNTAIVSKEGSYRFSVDAHGSWHFELATSGSPWYSEGTVAASWIPILLHQWVVLTGVYDGQTISDYQDGSLCGASQPLVAGPVALSTSPLELGKSNSQNMNSMNGDVCDLRIVESSRPPTQNSENPSKER